jgi:hypothetical protein
MKILQIALGFCSALIVAGAAGAQDTMRVRGNITALEGNVLSVKTRDGRDLKLMLPENVSVAVAKAVKFEDIKQGDYVGATTTPGPDGTPMAVEVHYIAPAVPEGHGPWDLQPNSSMTNARVGAISSADGKRELTLRYKGGTQKVVVPEGTPLVRAVPGTRDDLKTGEYIFAAAQVGNDGTLTAPRIQVSKDGVKPPQ